MPLSKVLGQGSDTAGKASIKVIEKTYRRIPKELKAWSAEKKKVDKAYADLKKRGRAKKADAYIKRQWPKLHGLDSNRRGAYLDLMRCFVERKGIDLVDKNSSKDMQVSLRIVARQLYDAGKMQEAALHYEKVLELSTKPEADIYKRTTFLPLSYLGIGEPDKAVAICKSAFPLVQGSGKQSAWIHLGHIYNAIGDVDAAKQQWKLAADTAGGGSAQRTLRAYGLEAVDLTKAIWVGGKKKPIAKLGCKAAIIAFLNTSGSLSRRVMVLMDDYHEAYGKSGLCVLGVVQPQTRGFMPSRKYPREFGLGDVRIPKKGMLKYLKQYRKNLQLGYPLLIGSQAEAAYYGVRHKGDFVVLDSSGRVAMISNGTGSLPFAKALVKRLLKEAR